MPIPRAKAAEAVDDISVDEVKKEAKGFIDKIIKDVGKTSATQQIAIGTASGWCTGYLAMKVGKVAAVAAGGGILLLQLAAHKGYININWDKLCRQVDKATDKIEKEATGKGPGFMDKMERFVDRKLDKAEDALRNNKRKARRWWNSLSKEDGSFEITKSHIFHTGFFLGLAISLVIHRR
ncbi:FUN14 domain-containing protein 1 [Thrips palmi]|uniref:FUN14 domain-containing protein 1 n=1 Tax=Thrips palmi TaxID=161013 RepID=A0A6P8ZP61_THRPL|nr:FUN14 domain-containing protein 1 [Thrips palmi]